MTPWIRFGYVTAIMLLIVGITNQSDGTAGIAAVIAIMTFLWDSIAFYYKRHPEEVQ